MDDAVTNSRINKVLVIDDDESFLDMLSEVLNFEGYTVETSTDPLEAIKRLGKVSFKCIVVDFHMPSLDGQDFLRLVHSRFPKIPVILCSGYLESRESSLIREGAFEVLHKPFDNHVLFDVLNRAITTDDEITPIYCEGFDLRSARETVTRKLIIKALTKCNFNVTHSAQLLGISRQYLLRYMKAYKIEH